MASYEEELLQDRVEHVLGSQKAWLMAEELQRALGSGFRSGKTRTMCLGGILFSYLMPGNFGFIGRAVGKDLSQTTIPTFLDEVCPPDWIVGKPRKVGQFGLEVYLKTRQPPRVSKIYFDYILDRQAGRSHVAGANWGWFGIDQAEEITRFDYLKLMSRLSRKEGLKKHALINFNQQGHNWIFEDFYQGGDYLLDAKAHPDVFFKAVRKDGRLGVVARAEENRISNGGFVADDYFDELRRTYPPSWIARFMDGSFDDFSGKIYPDYNLTSVHNIEPFAIPKHWPTSSYIDPGGSCQWAVGVCRTDEYGNHIITNDAEPLYRPNLNPNTVIRWVKDNTEITRTQYVYDYENKPVMTQFQDEGILCEPARKDFMQGVLKVNGYMFVMPERPLPRWYRETQSAERWEKFRGGGAPKIFVFNTCKNWRTEHDNYMWDPNKKNVAKKGDDHHADGTRYLLMSNPMSALISSTDPYEAMRLSDPTSAFHNDSIKKEIDRLTRRDRMATIENMDSCDGGEMLNEGPPRFISDFGQYT